MKHLNRIKKLLSALIATTILLTAMPAAITRADAPEHANSTDNSTADTASNADSDTGSTATQNTTNTPNTTNAPTITYITEPSGEPITNPHKGFVMTVYGESSFASRNPYGIGGSNNNHAWDVVTICSGEPYWEDLNPEEDVYDWTYIDNALEQCEKYGLTYGIRVIPYSTSIGPDTDGGLEHDFVPQWVYDKGAKHTEATYRWQENSPTILVPDWSNEIYLEAHKKFVQALADRYDNDPRVEFIDVRPFGNWGEWHTTEFIGSDMPSIEIQQDMLRFYRNAFKHKTLAVPVDTSTSIYDFALSIGITMRNDGMIMVPDTEKELIPAYEANLPAIAENHNIYEVMLQQTDIIPGGYLKWTPERFRNTIETAHLSIYALDQASDNSYKFYSEQKDVIDQMVNRLGYNFTVTSATRTGNTLTVTVENTGLAPAFFDIRLCAELLENGNPQPISFGEPVIIPSGTFHDGDSKTYTFTYSGDIPSNANICLALYDVNNTLAAGKNPTVRFDNKNNQEDNRLLLVPVAIPTDVPTVTPTQPTYNVADFVERLYTVALDRESDPDGKATWIKELQRGLSASYVAEGFLNSYEFLSKDMSNEEYIKILYRTFFDREPDSEGFKTWSDYLKRGIRKEVVLQGFINSVEWANLCLRYGVRSGGTGSPTITIEPNENIYSFVTRLYTILLDRDVDEEGLNHWSSLLSNLQWSGTNVAYGFIMSDEFLSKDMTDEEFVTKLYLTLMNRTPDAQGLQDWLDLLKEDEMTRPQMFFQFSQSEEWINICLSYGILK